MQGTHYDVSKYAFLYSTVPQILEFLGKFV
jgi:hypothetical protein